MNLTSKRMLQFLTVCAGVCALSASAQTIWVSDNFEQEDVGYTNAALDSAAGIYKMNTFGTIGNEYTNLAWSADVSDASKIVTTVGTYGGNHPITNANAQAQSLELATEGQTLTRYVNMVDTGEPLFNGIYQKVPGTVSFSGTPVFVDTLMKFTPSEDDPEITDPNIKLALFVNASSNLVIRHCMYTNGLIPTTSVFTNFDVINPEQWYRLTIKMQYDGTDVGTRCWLWIDGTPLTHYNGEVDQNNVHNGPVFWALTQNSQLTQISFQGTGAIDDLVVTDIAPDLTPDTGILLTLAFDDALMDVYANGNLLTSSPTNILSGKSFLVTNVVDWYEFNGISGEGISFDGPTGALVRASSGTLVADTTDRTATVEVATYAGTWPQGIEGAFTAYSFSSVAAWAAAHHVSQEDALANADAYLDNYLLNIDETTAATLQITSIVIDQGEEIATITLSATDDSETDAVDFEHLNGTVSVWAKDNLTDTSWGDPQTFTVTLTTATEVTIQVPYAAGSFLKAVVQ